MSKMQLTPEEMETTTVFRLLTTVITANGSIDTTPYTYDNFVHVVVFVSSSDLTSLVQQVIQLKTPKSQRREIRMQRRHREIVCNTCHEGHSGNLVDTRSTSAGSDRNQPPKPPRAELLHPD